MLRQEKSLEYQENLLLQTGENNKASKYLHREMKTTQALLYIPLAICLLWG